MRVTNEDDILAGTPDTVPADSRRGEVPGTGLGSLGTALKDARWSDALFLTVISTIVMVGSFFRLIAAIRLSPHVDEAASILAATVVAEHFLPVLPSGTVYFQGFPLSLLLAPFAWFGLASLDDLVLMRLVSVMVGTAAVWLSWRFGASITGNRWVGVCMAFLVAVDPLSVQWSGHVRMYALLQLTTIALVWAYIRLLSNGVTWRRSAAVVVLSWVAVFTHIGAALLIVSMGLTALLLYRLVVFRHARLVGVLGASGLAPVALLLLNEVLARGGEDISFVGESQVSPFQRFQNPDQEWQWTVLLEEAVQFWFTPVAIVGGASVIAGYLFLRRHSADLGLRAAVVHLLSTYWVTTLAFCLFTSAMAGRYLLHVQTIGYALVAMIVVALFTRTFAQREMWRYSLGTAITGLTVAMLVVSMLSRVWWRYEHPVVAQNYHDAMEYVSEHHTPGQPVIVALPPVGYLGMPEDERDDLYFLAGPEGGLRARSYSSLTDDGRRIDYWVGMDTIVSAQQLRDLLLRSPGAMLVIDSYRLNVSWAYAGDIEAVIRDLTTVVYRGEGGSVVMQPVLPPDHKRDFVDAD